MTTAYTDTQLLRMFPALLPEEVFFVPKTGELHRHTENAALEDRWPKVKPTELLDLCRRIEEKMTPLQQRCWVEKLHDKAGAELINYDDCYYPGDSPTVDLDALYLVAHASWQQRVVAASAVMGVDIS